MSAILSALFTLVCFVLEYGAYAAIIADICLRLGLINTKKKNDVPGALRDTLKGTNDVLKTVMSGVQQFSAVFEEEPK